MIDILISNGVIDRDRINKAKRDKIGKLRKWYYKTGGLDMPDITMCVARNCPKRMSCYRYTATPAGQAQSWVDYSRKGMTECEDYWDNLDKGAKIIMTGQDEKG